MIGIDMCQFRIIQACPALLFGQECAAAPHSVEECATQGPRSRYVVNPMPINLPFGDGVYNPFMMGLLWVVGIVY